MLYIPCYNWDSSHPPFTMKHVRIRRSLGLLLLPVILTGLGALVFAGDTPSKSPETGKKTAALSAAPVLPGLAAQEPCAVAAILPSLPATGAPLAPPRGAFFGTEAVRLLDLERKELTELHRLFREAPDHASALAIQRQIEGLKIETELSLLRLQADWARLLERERTARAIETTIDKIRRPRETPVRTERPEPRSIPQPAESH